MRGGNQKVGPCEGIPVLAEDALTVFRPGAQVKVKVKETVPHPGHFRIMFDADVADGEDFLDPVNCDDVGTPNGTTLLADNLLPAQGGTCPGFHTPSVRTPIRDEVYEFEITLPNIECDNCVLQVVQVMTDAAKADPLGNWDPTGGKGLYFRCSNLKLSATDDPTPVPGTDPGDGTDPDTMSPGNNAGCSATAPSGTAGFAVIALFLGIARRRTTRPEQLE